ncbi:MAG: PIN domain-containing protein [Desulfovibrionaceae bacterium]|nr:PIN domain-containing protein [Desulfovibrionaceae bacterium]
MSLIYMLDTSISSAAIRCQAAVSDKLATLPANAWCISAVTVAEHLYGLAKRPEARTLARTVQAFLRVADVRPWDSLAAQTEGQLRATLERQGTPLDAYDCMIAAHALSLGIVLVTDNIKHFDRVPNLTLENWLRTEG